MSVLAALSYDQIAVVGCGLALLFCIACMAIASNNRKRRFAASGSEAKHRSPILSPKKPIMTP
ncbi:MAG: hypothetical protein KDA84_28020 [Planctomycetaceae bacterium]|nr:hypothetical protein [Planctomycetaceae bacterium]